MRVAVVPSSFGGVFAELAAWLGAELLAAGADVGTRPADVAGADLVVLLGAGPEFDPLLTSRRSGRRVVLWAFDPLPPPDLPGDAFTAGYRRGARALALRRLERRLPFALGAPGSLTQRRLTARRLALGLVGARQGPSPVDGLHPVDAVFTFGSLAWIERSVRRGALDEILVSAPASVRTLAARGIEARYQPVVPHPGMGRLLERPRDLPVVFIGSGLDSRGPRLARFREALAVRGARLVVVDRACHGEERTALLNRAQVVLNLHKFPWHLERIRLLLAASNGALFASELPVPDPEPFVVGRDLVAASEEALADVIAEHVDSPARDAKVANASEVLAGLPDLASVARQLLDSARVGGRR